MALASVCHDARSHNERVAHRSMVICCRWSYTQPMNYRFTLEPSDFELQTIHGFLSESYWANGIPLELVAKAIRNSLCFGVMADQQLVAFGRFVTDSATFAYLADVFVLPEHRGNGLSKLMLVEALKLPDLQGLRRIMLATKDAHGLYKRFGFEPLDDPSTFLQLAQPDIYLS